MSLNPKQIVRCLYDAMGLTINHDGIEHAGYLAFLGLLALFPFLVFMVAVIGVMGQGEAGALFLFRLMEVMPENITAALRPRVVEIISGPPQGLLTVSILGAIWTASSAVEGIRTVLNRAYHVSTPPAYWLRRLLSIAQLLIFTFISIAAMLLVIALPLVLHDLEGWLGIQFNLEDRDYWGFVIVVISLAAIFGAVSYLYYFIPNIRQHTISVVPGAALVVFGWWAAARLFTLYLSNFQQVNLIYGSLGGFIAALIFFYLCNIIFIFGAEFNYQIVRTVGMRVEQREETTGTKDTLS